MESITLFAAFGLALVVVGFSIYLISARKTKDTTINLAVSEKKSQRLTAELETSKISEANSDAELNVVNSGVTKLQKKLKENQKVTQLNMNANDSVVEQLLNAKSTVEDLKSQAASDKINVSNLKEQLEAEKQETLHHKNNGIQPEQDQQHNIESLEASRKRVMPLEKEQRDTKRKQSADNTSRKSKVEKTMSSQNKDLAAQVNTLYTKEAEPNTDEVHQAKQPIDIETTEHGNSLANIALINTLINTTLLSSTSIPEHFYVVRALIVRETFEHITVAEFLEMPEHELKKLPYMGAKKFQTAKELKVWLQDSSSNNTEPPNNSDILASNTLINTTLLSNISIPEHFYVVRALIVRETFEHITVAEFLEMPENEIKKLPYMGAKKFQTANELKVWLQDLSSNNTEAPDNSNMWPNKLVLSQILLNIARLDETEHKLIEKISRNLKHKLNDLTLDKLIYDYKPTGTILGQPTSQIFKSLLERVKEQLLQHVVNNESSPQFSEQAQLEPSSFKTGMLLRYAELTDITAEELDSQLSHDLTLYMESLPERERQIFTQRFAIDGQPYKTLEQIGQSIPESITRERIRQLEAKLVNGFMNALIYIPETIWNNVRHNLNSDIDDIYTELGKRFADQKHFIRLLEIITRAEKGEFNKLIHPYCTPTILNSLFAVTKAPITKQEAIDYIADDTGYSLQQSANALFDLADKGILELSEDHVAPRKLLKPLAIAQGALHFPDGAAFRELHQFINQQGYCESELPTDRTDDAISHAIGDGYIYQSGHGHYRHQRFLTLDEEDKSQILFMVNDYLEQGKLAGRDTLHLMVDIYDKGLNNHDYFEVRHVVRDYGATRGIYFKGKSGADTVSLKQDFVLKSQKQSILELFETEPKPRSAKDISDVIRSGSVNHAAFYINELVQDFSLVRVDSSHWDLPHNAFNNAPVAQILDRAKHILTKAQRPVEIGMITDECNSRLHLQYPKAWYVSCLRYQTNLKNILWFFHKNAVSLTELNDLTLHKLIRERLDLIDKREELIAHVMVNILASRASIGAAINAVKTQMAQKKALSSQTQTNDNSPKADIAPSINADTTEVS